MSKMQTQIVIDGEEVYVWRSGFELVLAFYIFTDVVHAMKRCIVLFTGWEQLPATLGHVGFDVAWVTLALCLYAWLRRRNARQLTTVR